MTDRAYSTDRYGFPVEPCDRCGGKGNLPQFSHVYGGVCIKCSGRKVSVPRGLPGTLRAEFETALRAASVAHMSGGVIYEADGTRVFSVGVKVGDVVRRHRSEPYREIVAVHVTRLVIGECRIGGRLRSFSLAIRVTFADGETREEWGMQWERKLDVPELVVLRDDLAGRARAAYEKTLARRKVAA